MCCTEWIASGRGDHEGLFLPKEVLEKVTPLSGPWSKQQLFSYSHFLSHSLRIHFAHWSSTTKSHRSGANNQKKKKKKICNKSLPTYQGLGCLMALHLSEQPQRTFEHSTSACGHISSHQWKLGGIHSRQPGISCLCASSHHPCCQPGATKYGCSVHKLCSCMCQPCLFSSNTSHYRWLFQKYFLYFSLFYTPKNWA